MTIKYNYQIIRYNQEISTFMFQTFDQIWSKTKPIAAELE